jgi:hypothetical protein
MKSFMKKYRSELIGVAIGTIAGWCYWNFVGCSSGSCAITSSPVNSSLYGAFTGGIFGSMFKKSNKQETKKNA